MVCAIALGLESLQLLLIVAFVLDAAPCSRLRQLGNRRADPRGLRRVAARAESCLLRAPPKIPTDFRSVRDAWESVVALFTSGAGIWLATLASTLIACGFGIWYGRKLQREDARLDRLRDIYGRLMEVALRWTPPELQLRVPGGTAEPRRMR